MNSSFRSFATKRLSAAVLVGSLAMCLSTLGATFHVELSGADANPGTADQPWRTIQKAASTAKPGDTVLVGQGDFGEMVIPKIDGTPGNYITFDGQGVATTKQFQIGKQFIKVRNFTFMGLTNKFTGMIQFNAGSHNAVIESNHIDPQYSRAVRGINWDFCRTLPIDINAGNNIIISNNIIEHVFDTPTVVLFGTNNLVVSNVLRTIRDADYFHVFGISNVIRGNSCIGFEDTPDSGNHMDCFQTFGNNGFASSGMVIEGNIFGYNFNPSDVDVAQMWQMEVNSDPFIHDWDIRNNVFFNLLKGECGVPSVRIYNNTFYQIWTNSSGGAIILNWSDTGRNNATNAVIMNNAFVECGRGDNQSGWYSWGDGSSIVTNTWKVDYNYVGGPNGAPKNQGLPITNQRWFEPHGVNGGNPGFQDVLSRIFTLTANSVLIDRGADLRSMTSVDLLGAARPRGGAFDIGAYEAALGPRPPTNVRRVAP